MFKYSFEKHFNGYTIASSGNGKNGAIYSIFTSDLINATQPLYTYFTSIKECEQFICEILV